MVETMGEVSTVTSKSMVTIPSRLRRKYGIREGMRIEFIETDNGVLMVPMPDPRTLFGTDRLHSGKLLKGIRELEKEHRREAAA